MGSRKQRGVEVRARSRRGAPGERRLARPAPPLLARSAKRVLLQRAQRDRRARALPAGVRPCGSVGDGSTAWACASARVIPGGGLSPSAPRSLPERHARPAVRRVGRSRVCRGAWWCRERALSPVGWTTRSSSARLERQSGARENVPERRKACRRIVERVGLFACSRAHGAFCLCARSLRRA